MSRVLFVTNGHGEIAIADRIAAELRVVAPEISLEHVALVGDVKTRNATDVGPRRRMPSGGLVAMGNVSNIARDLRGGLARLTVEQIRFLRSARSRYDAVVATGDVFALWMALQTKAPVVYVGTAKSVAVAPYGPGERWQLRNARAVFVRDDATAEDLRRRGVPATAPGNVIADLLGGDARALDDARRGFEVVVSLLPGSRERAYGDALALVNALALVARDRPTLGGVLSIAPGVDAARMAAELGGAYAVAGTSIECVPFEARVGDRAIVRAWSGDLGPLLAASAIVFGQAGTANEAAAAAGRPVVAIAEGSPSEGGWYRKRQARLLGDALVVAPPDPGAAAKILGELVDDASERERRGAIGRERMGAPGGARRIATEIARIAGGGE